MDKNYNKIVVDNHISDIVYDDKFFDFHEEPVLQSARTIVPILLNFINVTSVVDFGCGRGAWLRVFQENGVNTIKGVDGHYVNQSRLLIDPSYFSPADLSKPFEVDGYYDLALCLEVAEHLPIKASRSLIATLTAAAPLVLFSAAIPGQGGEHHVNEQWPPFWRSLFAERGFRRLDPIRQQIWRDSRIESYYRQNLFLYASEAAIANSSVLQAEEEIAANTSLALVNEYILYRYATVEGLLSEIPKVAWRTIKRRLYR